MEKISWTDRVKNGKVLHRVKEEGKENFSMMSACVLNNCVITSHSHGILRVISNISLKINSAGPCLRQKSSVMLLFSRYVQGGFFWGGGYRPEGFGLVSRWVHFGFLFF